MKKLSLFLAASLMISSTFLSASCGDDEEEVQPEKIADEWLDDNATTAEEDANYKLYSIEGDWEVDPSQVDPSQLTNPNPLSKITTDVTAKAMIMSETNIEKYNTLQAINDLAVTETKIDGNVIAAYLIFTKVKAGQLVALETSQGSKGVVKVTNLSADFKNVSVKGYLRIPKK
ncbi:MAG: hypothetical protein IKS00_04265 [Bacteroidales bacterium]|jgi:hypothetical protein|nr:hypothetical protein [Bacteroidales bacterium]